MECKFSEWLVPSRKRRDILDGRYFPAGAGIWREAGLPACQAVAVEAGYLDYLQVRYTAHAQA